MKKLNKEHLKRKAEPSKALASAGAALEESAAKLNAAIEAHNELAAAYNAAIEEAKEWCEEVVSEIDDYVSERSEKWQEGDAASALEEWKSQFENFDPEGAEEVEEIEVTIEHEFDEITDGVE